MLSLWLKTSSVPHLQGFGTLSCGKPPKNQELKLMHQIECIRSLSDSWGSKAYAWDQVRAKLTHITTMATSDVDMEQLKVILLTTEGAPRFVETTAFSSGATNVAKIVEKLLGINLSK